MCEYCALAKAKQKNVDKEVDTKKKASQPNKQWLSIISISKLSQGSSIIVSCPNWHMTTYRYCEVMISSFYNINSDIVEPMCAPFNKAHCAAVPLNIFGRKTPKRTN